MTATVKSTSLGPKTIQEYTRFNELLTAYRTSQFNFKPTWGVSTIRYTKTETGTGASVGESNGEFLLQSGTANSGLAQIKTNERGQYKAGAMGQAGIGVRMPAQPASTAFAEWGYTDFTNGFYFGWDATGVYVAIVTGGSATKTYQSNWNVDTLEGTGPSGELLDLTDGVVCQIDFTWYGYGDIEFSFLIKNPDTLKIKKTVCHRIKNDGSASIIDPNQPLSFRVGNGASGTTNTSLYIGGHQFSIINGQSQGQTRVYSELLTNYTTATNTNWQPIIAFREKATLNGRDNSVVVRALNFVVASDGNLETRITYSGTTNNLSWGTPTGLTATETAIESKVTTTGTALTTSAPGFPIEYGFVPGGATGRGGGTNFAELTFPLGVGQEVILWIRRLSGTGAIIVQHAHVSWLEEW